MKIDQIRVYTVRLPFAFDFSHAQRKRAFANNVVVEVVAEAGALSGFGEGAPRSYVTGETPATAAASIASAAASPAFCWDLSRPDQIRTWMAGLDRDRFGNAARCALELALLDVLGRRLRRPVIDFFPGDVRLRTIFYGAALPLAPPDLIEKGCRIVRELGIRKLKLKLGADLTQNQAMLEAVASVFGDDCELKVDVNFAWDLAAALAHIPLLTRHRVKVVEQPLTPGDPDRSALAAAMAAEAIVLMADESACTVSDLETICNEGSFEMINMRLSKCGGFFRSLEMIDYLRGAGLSFQVACHLGESGILSAAGRALGLLCGDALYWDGSYDAFLLRENLTTEDVTFGPAGRAGPLPGPGLGVDVSREALRRLTGGEAPVVFKRP
jgi:muconate cycloisomerase